MPIVKDDRRLRIGVLGCGPIAQMAHFDACRKGRNTELEAICDVSDDLVAKMAAVHSPHKTYRDLDAMLADDAIDAVIVATSDSYHVPLCLRVVEAGKHCFVEKPLGVTVEDCESLAVAVRARTGLVFQIGTNRRFDPGVSLAKRFIDSELGGLMAYKGWYCDSTRRYTMTDNLQPIVYAGAGAKKPSGDPKANKRQYFMLAHGSHLVDTARFLGGPIEAVRAKCLERYGAFCWFVDTAFANGSNGHLDLTIPLRGDFQEGFQIYGELGSIYGQIPLPWYHKSGHVECYSDRDGQFRRVLGEDAYTYKLQLEGFASTILDGTPQWGANVEDGLAAVRAMAAINRSAETGRDVALADAEGAV